MGGVLQVEVLVCRRRGASNESDTSRSNVRKGVRSWIGKKKHYIVCVH